MRRLLADLLGRRDWREDVSAYLDDELTASERARVEARLAQSEEMRAYLDDLREMRSMLRGFASEPARAPFQITPEMLNTRTATQIRPGAVERALRVSMTTAAIGVATFSAVLIFDAVDRPSVSFTPTAAGDQSTSVPTAQIVTDQVEQQVAETDDSSSASVTVVSIESGEPDQAAQQAAAQQQQSQQAQQAQAFALEEAEQEAQEQAYEEEHNQQEYEEQDYEQAANDPSRRAMTAGRADGASVQESVNAEDVVAQPDEQAAESSGPPAQAEPAAEASEPEAVSSPVEDEAEQPAVQADAKSETRTVATSVRHVETDWPLDQRPQTSSIRVATDPSWEAPVQIVLAIIAFGATIIWFLLTIMDRRRRT